MRLRVAGVAILTVVLSGCWVLDELDEGNKKLDMYTAGGKAAAAEEEGEAAAPAARRGPRLGEYFANQKNARTLTKGQLPSDIVACKLDGGTQFMKQAECLSRGGVPKS